MRILFVLDPLERLSTRYDSSLYLLKEFYRRGHDIRVADVPDIFAADKHVLARTRTIKIQDFSKKSDPFSQGRRYTYGKTSIENLEGFDLLLIRKEPPFDLNYLYLTYLLDLAAKKIPVSNHPAGIRNNNEKLAPFKFEKWNARSIVTSRPASIVDFQRKLEKDLVVKPLDNRAGFGVALVPWKERSQAEKILRRATRGGKRTVLAQEFLGEKPYRDKRITLLNGKVLFVYEKEASAREFRTNLCRGGVIRPAILSPSEEKLVEELKPYLKKEGLHLAGLDVLEGKVIDFNVTCPGGFWDAKELSPKLAPVEAWADFLERLAGT